MSAAAMATQLFILLCLAAIVCSQNPLLMQQQHRRQQQRDKLALQKLQVELMYLTPPDESPGPIRRYPPATASPFVPVLRHLVHQRQRDGASSKDARSSDTSSKDAKSPDTSSKDAKRPVSNRNEMHQHRPHGAPGPTPWTRWTPKPKYRNSPWDEHKGKNKDSAQCGGRRYSAREHICCDNHLQKRQGLRPACCGTQSFDFVFNLCCNGKVTPRTAERPFC